MKRFTASLVAVFAVAVTWALSPGTATAAVSDSYDPSGAAIANVASALAVGSTAARMQAQSFTAGASGYISSAKVFLAHAGSPTAVKVAIYAHTGNFGAGGTPTGAALATSDTVNSSATVTYTCDGPVSCFTAITFNFSSSYYVTSGTKYCLVVSDGSASGDNTNYYRLGRVYGGTAVGNASSYNGTSWSADMSGDVSFEVDDSTATPTPTPTATPTPTPTATPTPTPETGLAKSDDFMPLDFFLALCGTLGLFYGAYAIIIKPFLRH